MGQEIAALITFVFATPPCPQIIVQPAPSFWATWAPAIINVIQFAGLAVLTLFTFSRGSKQKVDEREAVWYHKVVVDHALAAMADFFFQSQILLEERTNKLKELSGATFQQEFDETVSKTLAEIKSKLHQMSLDIAGRLAFFNTAPTRDFLKHADNLEDEIAKWFDTFKRAEPFLERKSLPQILRDSQIVMFSVLRDFEFKSWGGR